MDHHPWCVRLIAGRIVCCKCFHHGQHEEGTPELLALAEFPTKDEAAVRQAVTVDPTTRYRRSRVVVQGNLQAVPRQQHPARDPEHAEPCPPGPADTKLGKVTPDN